MKGLWIAPVFALCMTGCALTLPTTETKPPVNNAPLMVKEVPVKQTVTVDQVTDENAKEKSLALELELEQAQNALVIGPDNTPPAPKAK